MLIEENDSLDADEINEIEADVERYRATRIRAAIRRKQKIAASSALKQVVEKRHKMVIKLRTDGLNYREIGERVGLSAARVHSILAAHAWRSERDKTLKTLQEDTSRSVLDRGIDSLILSTRAFNGLHFAMYNTIRDVAKASDLQLRRIPNFGEVSLNEVHTAIAKALKNNRNCLASSFGGCCSERYCPQTRDGEPAKSNRICPLMTAEEKAMAFRILKLQGREGHE